LPREAWARLERVLERFEDAWRRGERPDLDGYLAEAGAGEQRALLVELIHTDLHYRLEAGQPARVEDYLTRYPDLAEDRQALLDLITAEYQLRRPREPDLTTREYRRRFPQHAEAIRTRLEPTGEDTHADGTHGRAAVEPAVRRTDTMLEPDGASLQGSTPEPAPADRADSATSPGLASPPGSDTGAPSTVPGYEIVGELGRGGMGVVLHGRDPDLGRDLAVKVLRLDHLSDPDLLRRFLEEAQIAGQLQHPGIAPIYARGQFPDGRPFFTMKLVQGQTLAELLASRTDPAQDLPRFLGIFEAVCQTLGYAHSRGVIHRDLKPANIMAGSFGEVQVMDWGLAKVLPAQRQAGQQLDTLAGAASTVRTVRSETAGLSSQAGAVLGTPAYMAPEQALGQVDRLDERCDVFGLGAILCEILTGQPPYTGAGWEVRQQATTGDLAGAWARLDACGADPELVQLAKTCLAPRPEDRPRNAGEVAKAVAGYLAGGQQRLRSAELERAAAQARAEEATAKVAAERRARRRLLGLAVAVLLLVVGSGFGAWRWHDQRLVAQARQQQTDQEVGVVLARARALLTQGWQEQDLARLKEAKAEGERAADIARTGGASTTVQQDAAGFQAEAEQWAERCRINTALRGALLDVSAPPEIGRYTSQETGRMVARVQPSVDEQYAAAFRRWGLDVDGLAESEVIARLRQEPDSVLGEVIAGLDAWMLERWRQPLPESRWRHLYRITEELDDQATRRQLRALLFEESPPRPDTVAGLLGPGVPWPALWRLARGENWRRVQELRGRMNPGREPVLTVVVLAQAYRAAGDTAGAVEVLRQAIAVRPDQLVLLHVLARLLEQQRQWEEAIGCYRAIRVRRPGVGVALGRALVRVGRGREGETVLRELVRQQPDHPELRYHLGNVLYDQRKYAAAESAYLEAIDSVPEFAHAHHNLGLALAHQGKGEEAIPHYQKAIALDSTDARPWNGLGAELSAQGKLEDAIKCFRKAIALDPRFTLPYNNLGYALRKQGKVEEAIELHRKALAIDSRDARSWNYLGGALETQGKVEEAIASYQLAITLDPRLAVPYYNLGTTLRGQGKPDEAIALFHKALEIEPEYAEALCNLGNALYDQGRFAEALPYLQRGHQVGSRRRSWRYPSAEWVRQCQRLLQLQDRLPDLLAGKLTPASEAERADYAECCTLTQLHAAAVRLYAQAFAAEPTLADDLEAGHRYTAACAAALAGCGQGRDAGSLGDRERTRLRRQALGWLRGDLTAQSKQLAGSAAEAKEARKSLARWQKDPDLAGVREPGELDKLPEEERRAWQKLWADVAALLKRTERNERPASKE
jgi:serine/threonine-protein kinase